MKHLASLIRDLRTGDATPREAADALVALDAENATLRRQLDLITRLTPRRRDALLGALTRASDEWETEVEDDLDQVDRGGDVDAKDLAARRDRIKALAEARALLVTVLRP